MPDGSDQRRVSLLPETEQYRPRWSPDGKRVSFFSSGFIAADRAELYVIEADGSGQTAHRSGLRRARVRTIRGRPRGPAWHTGYPERGLSCG